MFFLFPRLEHPAGWICARYKSLLLVLLLSDLRATDFDLKNVNGCSFPTEFQTLLFSREIRKRCASAALH